MGVYEQGYDQGVRDRKIDVELGGAYSDVQLSEEGPWHYGYREGYLKGHLKD